MGPEQRWILFVLLSLTMAMVILTPRRAPQPKPEAAAPATATTATLAEAAWTSPVAATPAPRPLAAATSSTLAGGSGLAPLAPESRPGALVSLASSKARLQLDSVGAVVRSWSLIDTGSDSQDRRGLAATTQGVELVQSLPPLADGRPAPQVWPLEVGLSVGGTALEELNSVAWTRKTRPSVGPDAATAVFLSPALSGPAAGLRVEKSLELPRDSYFARLRLTLRNEGKSPLRLDDGVGRGASVRWGPGLMERKHGEALPSDSSYDAAVFRTGGVVHTFRPAPDAPAQGLEGPASWGGVEAKFFAALLVPIPPGNNPDALPDLRFRAFVPAAHKAPQATAWHPPLAMELAPAALDLVPGASQTYEYGLYVGPKKSGVLKEAHAGLETLMFAESWPFMRAIYRVLTSTLNALHRFVGNYGIAIILLTMFVRVLVFPLTHKAIKYQAQSMREMQIVKPHLDSINEQFKGDPAERQRRTMQVYQEHGISPFGALRGCLPVMAQMPIFVGLYKVCSDTIDLQGARFLWIHDLSRPDQLLHWGAPLPILGQYFNLLPFVMGATQMAASKIAMARMDFSKMEPSQAAMQKQMMYLMPAMMVFVLYGMPAGLMVYWCTSNCWQIFQTVITNRIMRNEEERLKREDDRARASKVLDPKSPDEGSALRSVAKRGGPAGAL